MTHRNDNAFPEFSGTWCDAPGSALNLALELPQGQPAPPLGPSVETLDPGIDPEVRSTTATGASEVIAATGSGAGVSAVVQLPGANGTWRLEGRVFRHGEAPSPVQVLFTEGDRVLAEAKVRSGETFVFQEVAGRDWALEIYPPSAKPLVLRNPYA